jgi:hypothetical protein
MIANYGKTTQQSTKITIRTYNGGGDGGGNEDNFIIRCIWRW